MRLKYFSCVVSIQASLILVLLVCWVSAERKLYSALTTQIVISRDDSSSESKLVNSRSEILEQGTIYFCDEQLFYPTVVARSDLGNVSVVEFTEELYGTAPRERCQEVALRLIRFHSSQNIGYLSWSRIEQGGQVVNVARYEGDIYSESEEYTDILMTLHPDDLVQEILEGLHGILSSYGDEAIRN